MSEQDKIQLFENQPIRTAWDEEKEEWYFSVVDVVGALTDQTTSRGASTYWAVVKKRLKDEGADQLLTNCKQLKMTAADGKKRKTDVATIEQLLRIIQSIPSRKAEPIRGMALESQEVFDASRGDGSKADVSRKALIKLRNELTRLYQMQCELRSAVQSDSEKAMVDALLEDLEKISRHAHEQTGFTYTSLEEIAVLN